MRRSIFLSLVLHAVLFAALYWCLRERVFFEPRVYKPLAVQIVPGPVAKSEVPAPAKPTHKKSPRLEDLAPALPHGGPDMSAGETVTPGTLGKSGTTTGAGSGHYGKKHDGFDVAAGMTIQDETKAYPFLESLMRRLDPVVAYPHDFVLERIEGKVTVHFNVDRRGVFVGDFLSVSSDDPALEAYVLALLAYVHKYPLPERSWGEQGTTLVVTVDFKVLAGFTGEHLSEASRFKNLFALRRASVSEPLLNEQIEKLMKKWLPPVVPLPGVGPYIDFVRAYQLIASIGSEKEDKDQRRRNRIELSREKWQAVVKERVSGVVPPG